MRAKQVVDREPGYMNPTKTSEQERRKRAAYERQRLQRERGAAILAARNEARAAGKCAADAVVALEMRWGGRADALKMLSDIGRAIARIRREEDELPSQRDELIDALRGVGETWNSLVSRTGLSRQALIKRRGDVDGQG